MDANTNKTDVFVLKALVQQKFNELRAALHMREKLLLRQLEVIANSQQMTGRGAPVSPTGEETTKFCGDVKFIGDQETELLAAIRSFGRFQMDNMNLALQDVYLKNEDYIEPADDHETMYKCLQAQVVDYDDDEDVAQAEAIVVDFSRNKSLVEDNAKLMNKSIINITLQEAKELIRKAKIKRETHVPPLNLEELDDEFESSIAEAVNSLGRETSKSSASHTCIEQQQQQQQQPQPTHTKPKTKKPRFKPKITINNCNGTINLRNIASLTINCASEEAVSAEIPIMKVQSADSSTATDEHSTNTTTTTPTASSSNYSSTASSRTHSKKQKQGSKKAKTDKQAKSTANTNTEISPTSNALGDDTEDGSSSAADVTCDFYNRLLNEIKKSLKEKPTRYYDNIAHVVQAAAADSTCDANLNPTTTSSSELNTTATTTRKSQQSQSTATSTTSYIEPGKRLILKNFENLKIILEANSGDEDAFHPVQIEQWLAEIISETDLEPMPNTDILEHSKITSESN